MPTLPSRQRWYDQNKTDRSGAKWLNSKNIDKTFGMNCYYIFRASWLRIWMLKGLIKMEKYNLKLLKLIKEVDFWMENKFDSNVLGSKGGFFAFEKREKLWHHSMTSRKPFSPKNSPKSRLRLTPHKFFTTRVDELLP